VRRRTRTDLLLRVGLVFAQAVDFVAERGDIGEGVAETAGLGGAAGCGGLSGAGDEAVDHDGNHNGECSDPQIGDKDDYEAGRKW